MTKDSIKQLIDKHCPYQKGTQDYREWFTGAVLGLSNKSKYILSGDSSESKEGLTWGMSNQDKVV